MIFTLSVSLSLNDNSFSFSSVHISVSSFSSPFVFLIPFHLPHASPIYFESHPTSPLQSGKTHKTFYVQRPASLNNSCLATILLLWTGKRILPIMSTSNLSSYITSRLCYVILHPVSLQVRWTSAVNSGQKGLPRVCNRSRSISWVYFGFNTNKNVDNKNTFNKYIVSSINNYYSCICPNLFISISECYLSLFIYILYIYIYIYIYIYTHTLYIYCYPQTVSLYYNSSVWLNTRDASRRDRNPHNFTYDW